MMKRNSHDFPSNIEIKGCANSACAWHTGPDLTKLMFRLSAGLSQWLYWRPATVSSFCARIRTKSYKHHVTCLHIFLGYLPGIHIIVITAVSLALLTHHVPRTESAPQRGVCRLGGEVCAAPCVTSDLGGGRGQPQRSLPGADVSNAACFRSQGVQPRGSRADQLVTPTRSKLRFKNIAITMYSANIDT